MTSSQRAAIIAYAMRNSVTPEQVNWSVNEWGNLLMSITLAV